MQDLRDVYPKLAVAEKGGNYWSAPSDYISFIKSMGYDIMGIFEEGFYQGTSYIFLGDRSPHGAPKYRRYGYLAFGWGSCLGCDALQATESFSELEALRESFHSKIVWRETWEKLVDQLEIMQAQPENYWEVNDSSFTLMLNALKSIVKDNLDMRIKWNLDEEYYAKYVSVWEDD